MARKKRKNGEGTWGTKTIKGVEYIFFRDPNGHYYYGHSEKEVKKKVAFRKNHFNENTARSLSDTKVKPSCIFYDYVKAYIENKRYDLQPYTYYNYNHMVDNLLKPSKLGRKQLAQICPDMINRYYDDLCKKYSYGTILSIHKILAGPVITAEDDGYIRINTWKKVHVPKERYCKPVEKIYVPDIQEMREIETLCFEKKKGKYVLGNNGLAYVFILHTGVRIGELIALRWKDIDMEKRYIGINKSASFIVVDGKQVYEDKEPKTKESKRKIPFDDTVYFILSYLKENYPPYLDPVEDFVFTNSRYRHMTKSSLEECLRCKVADKLNMPRLTPHGLRHAYSSYLAYKKVNPKVIAKLMGHSKVNMTFDTYVEGYQDEMIDAANLFNEITKREE